MSNGPEHYRTAEQHLRFAGQAGDVTDVERTHLLYASVHATLALAAATATGSTPLQDVAQEWVDAGVGRILAKKGWPT